MTTVEIFSPVGRAVKRGDAVRNTIPELSGSTIGVLENTKPNARHILVEVANQVAERYRAADVIVERKKTASEGAPPGMIQRLSGAAHLVFAGSGD